MKINARPDCFGNQAEPLLRGKPVDRCIDCELFDKCHKITVAASLHVTGRIPIVDLAFLAS